MTEPIVDEEEEIVVEKYHIITCKECKEKKKVLTKYVYSCMECKRKRNFTAQSEWASWECQFKDARPSKCYRTT